MTQLTIRDLKSFIENLPEDYTIEFYNSGCDVNCVVSDKLEVDLSGEKLILKS